MKEITTSRALIDLFRCPEEYGTFLLQDPLSAEAGFFRFGPDVIAWGRTTTGTRSQTPLGLREDLLPLAEVKAGELALPFDPDEVAENLRWERYATAAQGYQNSVFYRLFRAGYYLLRPFLRVGVRKYIQRAYLHSWHKIAFPNWPVDTTVGVLLARVLALSMRAKGKDRIPFIWFWPDGYNAAVMMTHDVETAAGRDFCPQLMDVNDRYGLKSSFHIIPEERYEVPDAFLDSLRQRGFEINIHGLNHDGRLFTYYNLFTTRTIKINGYVKLFGARGFRSPVMYRNLNWFHHLDVDYDMSVPNVAHLDPQRGGCCTVFPYFIGGILELPLTTIQDYSLFNIIKDYDIELWRQQVEIILGRHGLISFNFHPDYLRAPQSMAVYEQLLAYLADLRQKERLWFALPAEINDWWRRRARMRLVPDGRDWRIEGEGSEHARLGFAVREGDKVSVQLAGGNAPRAL